MVIFIPLQKEMERGSKRQTLRAYERESSDFLKTSNEDNPPVIRQKIELRRNNLNISTPIHTVFLRNLNFDITKEELESIASEFGEVAAVYSRASKRGIAFITFYDLRDAQKAVNQLENRNVHGRELHTSYAYSPPDHAKRDLSQNCSTITVTVPITEEDENIDIKLNQIEAEFSQFGEIRLAENGKNNNQFIIRYYDLRGARKAVENSGNIEINSKKLTIALNLEDDEDLKSQPTEQEKANDKKSDIERRKYKREQEIKNRKKRRAVSNDYSYPVSYQPVPPTYSSQMMPPNPYWQYGNYPPPLPPQSYPPPQTYQHQQPYQQPFPQPYQQQYPSQQMMYQGSQQMYQPNYANSNQQPQNQFLQMNSNNENKPGMDLFGPNS